MKNNIIQNVKGIVLGLIIVLGISYVSAAWRPAPANPPLNNADAPINVGGIMNDPVSKQEKTGDLDLQGVLRSFHLFTPDLTVTSASPITVGQVLTAIDANGRAGWRDVPAGGGGGNGNGVTRIIAGNGISVNPITGIGDVTVTNTGNSHIYTATGDNSVSINTSWSTIPDMSITQTFITNKIFILFNSPISYNPYASIGQGPAFRILIDGESKKQSYFGNGDATVIWSGNITPGQHTISISSSAGSTANSIEGGRTLTVITGQ